jgi:hypothetical protein
VENVSLWPYNIKLSCFGCLEFVTKEDFFFFFNFYIFTQGKVEGSSTGLFAPLISSFIYRVYIYIQIYIYINLLLKLVI